MLKVRNAGEPEERGDPARDAPSRRACDATYSTAVQAMVTVCVCVSIRVPGPGFAHELPSQKDLRAAAAGLTCCMEQEPSEEEAATPY